MFLILPVYFTVDSHFFLEFCSLLKTFNNQYFLDNLVCLLTLSCNAVLYSDAPPGLICSKMQILKK